MTVVVGAVAYLGSGVVATWALTRPRAPFAEPPPAGWEALRLESDVEVGAWWYAPSNASRVVVMAHGNGASRTQLHPIATALAEEGCAILSVTLRGHGDSASTQNDIGWSARNDVTAAVREAHRRRPALPIYVYGVSMGAAATLFASETITDKVAGAVLVAPYADLADAVRRRTTKYLPSGIDTLAFHALRTGGRLVLPQMDQIAPIVFAEAFHARALLIAGDIDDRAPPVDAHKLAFVMPRANVVIAEGMQHEDLADLRGHRAFGDVLAFLRDDRFTERDTDP